jgi:hypothetical protein
VAEAGAWPERPGDEEWEAVTATLTPGDRVTGTVLSHRIFGFFVRRPEHRVPGLVEITSYRPRGETPRYQASGDLKPAYPAIGSLVEAEFLGFRERERQLALRYLDPAVE